MVAKKGLLPNRVGQRGLLVSASAPRLVCEGNAGSEALGGQGEPLLLVVNQCGLPYRLAAGPLLDGFCCPRSIGSERKRL